MRLLHFRVLTWVVLFTPHRCLVLYPRQFFTPCVPCRQTVRFAKLYRPPAPCLHLHVPCHTIDRPHVFTMPMRYQAGHGVVMPDTTYPGRCFRWTPHPCAPPMRVSVAMSRCLSFFPLTPKRKYSLLKRCKQQGNQQSVPLVAYVKARLAGGTVSSHHISMYGSRSRGC